MGMGDLWIFRSVRRELSESMTEAAPAAVRTFLRSQTLEFLLEFLLQTCCHVGRFAGVDALQVVALPWLQFILLGLFLSREGDQGSGTMSLQEFTDRRNFSPAKRSCGYRDRWGLWKMMSPHFILLWSLRNPKTQNFVEFWSFLVSADLQFPPAPPHPWTLAIQRPEAIKVSLIIHNYHIKQHIQQSPTPQMAWAAEDEQFLTQGLVCLEKWAEVVPQDVIVEYFTVPAQPWWVGGSRNPDCDLRDLTAASLGGDFREDGNISLSQYCRNGAWAPPLGMDNLWFLD